MIVLESRGQIHQEALGMDAAQMYGVTKTANDSAVMDETYALLRCIDSETVKGDPPLDEYVMLAAKAHTAMRVYRARQSYIERVDPAECIYAGLLEALITAKVGAEFRFRELQNRDKDSDQRMLASMRRGSW